MNLFRAAGLIARKDLRIELRTKEITATTALFALLVAVLASLSFYVDFGSARSMAPGVLWVTITFAGVLAMSRSWARERDHDAMRALLLAPIPRAAIYLGKTASTFFFLLVVEALLVPFVALLFHVELPEVLLPLLLFVVLGTLGFVAAGSLFAALTVRTAARDLMLSVVVFPLVSPALLSAVVATRELFGGTPFDEVAAYARILVAYDIVFLTAGTWLFEPLAGD